MFVAFSMIGTICWSCWADQDPVRPRGRPVDVQVEQAIPDGCARFQIHANPAQSVTIDSIYGTQYCQTDELKLIQDSAAVFDAVTGKLRVPIVVKNVGTRAVRGLLKVRYDADSVTLFDANGNPVAGPTNIVGLGDSTLNNGRVAYWGYLPILQPAGQLQVLFAGQTSRRRWLELQGTDWNRTVKIKLFTTARYDTVPAVAPDTVPLAFDDDSNFVKDPARSTLPFRRDAVVVWFKRTATPSARAAAIQSVGGVVVGGQRISGLGDGAYVVQLAPDPSNLAVFAAVVTLNANASVSAAMPEYKLDGPGAYQKPNDQFGWVRSKYHVQAESAYVPAPFRDTWALDAIRAPLAWGCSTGDAATRMAVVDQGFHFAGMPDLSANHGDTVKIDVPGFSWQHGTAVAMIMAARGGNALQMSGVVWNARLDLRDVTLFKGQSAVISPNGKPAALNRDVVTRILEAAQNGARVINVSLGKDTAVTGVARQSLRNAYAQLAHALKDGFANQLVLSDLPLLVVAAGNNSGADPTYSYFPVIADSFPTSSLIVTASARDSGLAYFSPPSNSLRPPDIAAPGADVPVITQGGAMTLTGTSFATPLVAGVAGLLYSFDPRLTTQDVRSLILQGATNHGWKAGSYPVLDAYESLRLAAHRSGAPLCGNRVFIKNDSSLTVERKLDDITSDDVIGTWSTGWPVMFVEHGGKSISNGLVSGSNVNFVFGANGWTSQSGGGVPSNSPFFRSHEGVTHDGDTTLYAFPIPTTNPTQVELYLGDSLGVPLRPKVTVPLAGANGAYVRALDLSRPRAFFAAQGTTSSTLYAIDFVNSTSALVPLSYTLDRVDWLGVAEDGTELRVVNRVVNGATCNIDFVSLRTADYGTKRRRVAGSKGANGFCAVDGAIAPRIATFGAPQGTTPFVAPPPPRRSPRSLGKAPTPP